MVFLKRSVYFKDRGTLRHEPIPTKPRFRSVPDVVVLNSRFRFLRNCSLSTNVFQGASFGIGTCLRWGVGCSTLSVRSGFYYSFLIAANGLSFIALRAGKNPEMIPINTAKPKAARASHGGI